VRLLDGAIAGLRGLNRGAESVLLRLCAILMAAMLVSIIVTVGSRLTGISAPWTEKVMLILLPSLAFIGAPVAYRRGSNVALTFLPDALPDRARAAHGLALHTLILFVLLIGLDLTLRKVGVAPNALSAAINAVSGIDLSEVRPFRAKIKIPVLNIEWRYVYMVMPAAIGLIILAGVEIWLRELRALIGPAETAPPPIRHFDAMTEKQGE
jgi:TRAP-type C4-dicarboxylate transport system permease small subunit